MTASLAGIGELASAFTKQFQVSTQLAKDIFGFQTKAEKKAIELKEKEQQFQHDIATLTNQQQYVLQQQLNGAKNETERYAILTNAVTQLRLKQQENTASSNNANVMLIISVLFLAIIALVIIRKTK